MLITILAFVLVLGLLVFVHELGHFITAVKSGVACDEFGFGFPPRAVGVQRRAGAWRWIIGDRELTDEDKRYGTVYSLNWIPLGGFVKIKGESGGQAAESDSFGAKPIWKRALILAAGVIMNIVLAYVLIAVGMMAGIPTEVGAEAKGAKLSGQVFVQVIGINAKSPAEQAGLRLGDVIVAIDGQKFTATAAVQDYVSDKAGKTLQYQLKRGDQELTKAIVPTALPETGKGGIGISITEVALAKYPWYLALLESAKATFWMLVSIFAGLWGLIAGLFQGQSAAGAVAGPIGIANMTGQMAQMGWVYLLQFAAVLSLNLAVINVLPIPALDGGRIVFLVVEKLRGKPMDPHKEALAHNIFFALLMLLVVVVTWQDLARLGCWTCFLSKFFN